MNKTMVTTICFFEIFPDPHDPHDPNDQTVGYPLGMTNTLLC